VFIDQDTLDMSGENVQSLKALANGNDVIGALSRKLLLQVYRHFDRSKDYESVFKLVKKNKEDQPVQHAAYWELLVRAKQPQKAVYEAAQFWPFLVHHQFNRLNKAIQIAHAYEEVGLPKKSFELLDQIQTRFEDEAEYWMAYGDLLLKTENWLEATALAVKLRSQRAGIKLLRPYAYYMEGIAQGNLNRRPSAANAFSELIDLSPLNDENTVLSMAKGMLDVGLGVESMEFLKVHDASLEDRLTYSRLLYRAAKAAGNSLALAEANQALLELKPNMPDTDFRLLETAILTLDDTETALEAFLAARSGDVLNDSQRLLVACAYMQQEKHQEAKQWLEGIDKSRLGSRESAMYSFSYFEWLVRSEQIDEAKKQLVLVNRQDLFPSQMSRLEALELQITMPSPLLFDQ
jgi:tetratricopeptide (TPR) repeat protein